MAILSKIFFCVGVGFCFSLLFLCPENALATSINQEIILQQINLQRQQAELQTLTLNETLTHVAELRALDMFNNNYFAHQSANGQMPWDIATMENYDYNILGENLALDYFNADLVINDWMASPDHRNNILNPQYSETGIIVMEKDQNILIVQIFAQPRLYSIPTTYNSIKDQSTVTIIPNNHVSENFSVLGTYNIKTPTNKQINSTNLYNLWLFLLSTSFFGFSLFLVIIPEKK